MYSNSKHSTSTHGTTNQIKSSSVVDINQDTNHSVDRSVELCNTIADRLCIAALAVFVGCSILAIVSIINPNLFN